MVLQKGFKKKKKHCVETCRILNVCAASKWQFGTYYHIETYHQNHQSGNKVGATVNSSL